MRYCAVIYGGLLTALFSAAAWAQPSAFDPNPAPAKKAPASPAEKKEEAPPAASPAPPADPVDAWIASAPLPAKLGQLMMVTLDATDGGLSLDEAAFLKSATPGAVLVRHAAKPALALSRVAELRQLERGSGAPLLVGADLYELGAPVRAGLPGFVSLPSMMAVAAASDAATAEKLGRVIALQMRGMGFDLYYGPQLALAPTLPGARASLRGLGGDPKFVAAAGRAVCGALAAQGVMPLPLGFPGGVFNRAGREAAVLTTPTPALRETDLLPYLDAVRDNTPMLQADNVLAPMLDPSGAPASLSEPVLRGLLRRELGYGGLVVAGPVDAAELEGRDDAAERVLKALQAGADMVLWRGSVGQAQRAHERLMQAVVRGELDAATVDTLARRVVAAKVEWRAKSAALAGEKPKMPSAEELAQLSGEVERRAVTLLHHRAGALPLLRDASTPVGVTGTAGVEELQLALKDRLKQVVEQPITSARHLGDIQRFEIERLTTHMRGLRTVVVVLTEGERPEGQVELVREIKKRAPRVVVVYLGHPAQAALLGEADAILATYSNPAGPGPLMGVVAEILAGEGPLAFTDLPDRVTVKAGEERTFSITDTVRTPAGRLPMALGERMPPGHAARFDPATAVRRAVWEFPGKKVTAPSAVWRFKEPGEYPVTLTVIDTRGDTRSRTFTMVAAP